MMSRDFRYIYAEKPCKLSKREFEIGFDVIINNFYYNYEERMLKIMRRFCKTGYYDYDSMTDIRSVSELHEFDSKDYKAIPLPIKPSHLSSVLKEYNKVTNGKKSYFFYLTNSAFKNYFSYEYYNQPMLLMPGLVDYHSKEEIMMIIEEQLLYLYFDDEMNCKNCGMTNETAIKKYLKNRVNALMQTEIQQQNSDTGLKCSNCNETIIIDFLEASIFDTQFYITLPYFLSANEEKRFLFLIEKLTGSPCRIFNGWY